MIKAGRISLGTLLVALFIVGCGGEAGDPEGLGLGGARSP